ncbi:glycogen synthase GlgA [Oleiharenicola lentus]|uniref:glycogen synthase GlgA n=1 Tax=Oleiharenicola lentus TaxID=2508720 RepID=UPI003F66E630
MRSLKILFVSPEVEPFVKVGGLADMVGSLPKELAKLGHDVRIVCPLYGSVKRVGEWRARGESLGVDVGPNAHWARTWETTLPGTAVPVYFLENDDFFARPEVYNNPWGSFADNDVRFAFLSRGALALCQQLGWVPDVAHCHDWTTGLVPVMVNTTLRNTELGGVATVLTVHNLEHQGYSPARMVEFARLPWDVFHRDALMTNGSVNLMRTGLFHSTKVTTVSPNYAEEVKTASGGFGLDGVLKYRAGDFIGIVNGIDDESWDPARDQTLPANYSATDLAGKATCKAALQARFGLERNPRIPLFGVVSRLASQKGLDLLAEVLVPMLDRMRVQLVLLGSGDAHLENTFRWANDAYRGRVGVHIGFDGKLARLIQAGSDFFVMPSRSEPCGLTQMYAMRYGTLPIVRATGGLVDTVENFSEGWNYGTGFVFHDATPEALINTLGWACATYYDRPQEMAGLQQRAMAKDFSWRRSAASYVDVYRWAVESRTGVYPE